MADLKLPEPRKYAQGAFFKLLLAGYAKGVSPEHVSRFKGDPGTKRNVWQGPLGLNGWHGIDEWRTTKLGNGSNGTTSIYYGSHLVWEMQYGGFYPAEVIPFLRQALLASYLEYSWCGGRGPELFEDGAFQYCNEPCAEDDFCQFSGVERIQKRVDGNWIVVGEHFYRGGFLFT